MDIDPVQQSDSPSKKDLWSSGNVALGVAAALALAAAAVFVVGMAVLMAGHMGGGMMWRGGSSSPQTAVVADASQVDVEIRDFDYTPRDLTVAAGGRVTWTNRDTAPHTATAKGQWDTGTLGRGESATLTFDKPGAYHYFCTIHPNMKATLTVR